MLFYLGTHRVDWLKKVDVPLFISRRQLARYKNLPRANTIWALDSGGFTELDKYGTWTINEIDYINLVRRFQDEIGLMMWVAPQDWMCEPWIVKKTGLSVQEHQRRTTNNYLILRTIAPDLPIIPVLQGWEISDYLNHIDLYEREGVDLTKSFTVGVGSVCRRQHMDEAEILMRVLASYGLKLHGFGFKVKGLLRTQDVMHSADSLSWSKQARYAPALEGCATHKNCANCLKYALQWREKLLIKLNNVSS